MTRRQSQRAAARRASASRRARSRMRGNTRLLGCEPVPSLHDDDPHRPAPVAGLRDEAAAGEAFVVGMRGDHDQPTVAKRLIKIGDRQIV